MRKCGWREILIYQYIGVLRRNPNFARLLIATSVSNAGSAMTSLALPLLVYKISGSAVLLGTVWAIRILSSLVILPISGVLADQLDRRRLLLLGNTASLFVDIAFLSVAHYQALWAVYGLVFALQALNRLTGPSVASLFPTVVPSKDLPAANGLRSGFETTLQVLAPAIGSMIAFGWGISWLFVVDALSYLTSVLVLLTLDIGAEHLRERKKPIGISADSLKQGVTVVLHSDILRIVFVAGFAGAVLARSIDVLMVPVLDRVLGTRVENAGYMYSVMSAGAFLASMIMPLLGLGRWSVRKVGLIQLIAGGILLVLFLTKSFLVALVILGLWALVDTLGGILLETHMQRTVQRQVFGRVASLRLITFTLGSLLGVGIGTLGQYWPPTYPMILAILPVMTTGMLILTKGTSPPLEKANAVDEHA